MTYQIGFLRKTLLVDDYGIYFSDFENEEGLFLYDDCFRSDYRLKIDVVLEKICMRKKLNSSKTKKTKRAIMNSPIFKNKLSSEGCWKSSLDDFNSSDENDLWDMINGHDLLKCLCYLNGDCKSLYGYSKGSFERALIKYYDYNRFDSTQLYKSLSDAGLAVVRVS